MKTFYFFSYHDHRFVGKASAEDWMTARKIVANETGSKVDDLLPYNSKSIWDF